MTNIEHTTLGVRNTKTLILSMLVMLVAASLASVAGTQQQARASVIYTVNSAGDAPDAKPGDGYCEVVQNDPTPECTLRAAIMESNANPVSPEVVLFGISGTGVHTISPDTELPHITDAVTINGHTQDGASKNILAKGTNAQLVIQLDGSKLTGATDGLHIDAPNVALEGLVINRFTNNVFVDDAAANTKIEGNFIGTAPSGTAAPSGSGNGVTLADHASPTNNTVGGSTPAARNLISGNLSYGVGISYSNYNWVADNLIGTQRDGKSALGNGYSGVGIAYGSDNVVGAPGNTIAFNGQDGVKVLGTEKVESVGNAMLYNFVFSNDLLGIDLVGGTEGTGGATANDEGDADTGSNNLQNKPVLASARKSATGKTVVKGTLNSNPGQTFYVQFFSNPQDTNEGERFLGSKTVSADGTGDASFSFATTKKISLGRNITATAANTTTSDSSEFSAPKKVVAS